MSFVPLAKDSFPNYALVLASEEQPLQELLPRHLAETAAAFGITVTSERSTLGS